MAAGLSVHAETSPYLLGGVEPGDLGFGIVQLYNRNRYLAFYALEEMVDRELRLLVDEGSAGFCICIAAVRQGRQGRWTACLDLFKFKSVQHIKHVVAHWKGLVVEEAVLSYWGKSHHLIISSDPILCFAPQGQMTSASDVLYINIDLSSVAGGK